MIASIQYDRIRSQIKLICTWVCMVVVLGVSNSALAEPRIVTFSASSPGLITGKDFLSQVVKVGGTDVEIKARGYTVEFDGNDSHIYGPYPTGDRIFGTTASGFTNRPGFGLFSQPLAGINTTGIDTDIGRTVYAPGFDNGLNGHYLGDNLNIPGDSLPKIEFAFFTFSSPVDVSQVIVDDVVNTDRYIWAAGGTTPPNLNEGLIEAFSDYSIHSSIDDASDGQFIHHFEQFKNVSYLAVGVPTPSSTVGAHEPFPTHHRYNEIYIVGLGVSPVPEPETYAMFLAGLGLLGWRMRNARS